MTQAISGAVVSWLGCGLAAVGLGYAVEIYGFGPWSASLAETARRVEAAERENAALEAYERRLPEVRAETERLEASLRELQARLPTQEQFGAMIRDFTEAARTRGLTLTVQAQPPAKREGVQSGQIRIELTAPAAGGYRSLRSFADWAAAYPRLLAFHRFELTASADGRLTLLGVCQSPVMFDPLLEEIRK